MLRVSLAARRVLRARPLVARTLQVRTLVTKKYTVAHEWIQYDDASRLGTMGITDYAQSSLGDVVFVELPAPGSEVEAGEPLGAVESVKAASDIYSPVTGTVQKVNKKLAEQPGLLNKSPEKDGWLCKIKLTEPDELDDLLTAEEYKEHCESDEH